MHKNINRLGYKTTKVGWIPKDWSVKQLGECADFLDSQRVPLKDEDRQNRQGIYPYYGASGIIDYIDDYLFDDELILLGEDGANILTRTTRLAFRVSGKVWVNNHAHVIKPSPDMCIGFLCEYLESIQYNKYNTGTAQPKLNKKVCGTIPIPLPSLPEQEAIAEVLECWDKAIRGVEKKIEKKRKIKTGLMQRLLSGDQRMPEYQTAEDAEGRRAGEKMPEGWVEVCLGAIVSISYGKDWKGVKTSSGGVAVYGTGGLMGLARKPLFQPPAILLGRKGTIDTPMFINEPFWAVDTTFVIQATSDVDMVYLYYKLILIRWKRYNEASGVPSLSRETIRGIDLKIPAHRKEQQAVASFLSASDSEIAALERKLAGLKDQKRYLLNNLVTGTIRLPQFQPQRPFASSAVGKNKQPRTLSSAKGEDTE